MKRGVTEKEIRESLGHEMWSPFPRLCALRMKDGLRMWEELGVGGCRADVVFSGGSPYKSVYGIEIKSDFDTLKRLPAQIEAYCTVFDRVWVVCTDKHVDKVYEVVPDFVGLAHAYREVYEKHGFDVVHIQPLREAEDNPNQNLMALARELTKERLLEFARNVGMTRVSRLTKWDLVERIIEKVGDEQMRKELKFMWVQQMHDLRWKK